jgi:hypothetical protein
MREYIAINLSLRPTSCMILRLNEEEVQKRRIHTPPQISDAGVLDPILLVWVQ